MYLHEIRSPYTVSGRSRSGIKIGRRQWSETRYLLVHPISPRNISHSTFTATDSFTLKREAGTQALIPTMTAHLEEDWTYIDQITSPVGTTTTEGNSHESSTYTVTADLLIPGRGEPIKNAGLVIEDKKIKHVGLNADLAKSFSHVKTTHVKILMPGMWDCHVHLMGEHKVSSDAFIDAWKNPVLAGARSARDVMLLLDAGFTSVREMAGYGLQLDQAIQEGSLVGPKIYSSNCIISCTGGHADFHDTPMDWCQDMQKHGAPFCVADGPDECMKAVRQQLRAGADVIKICGSGGVGSERDNPMDQQFTSAEMEAMVEVATQAQRIVGAHCHGKGGIDAALRAGVKTIEHGSYLDEESADLMIKKDAILVATRLIVENGLKLRHFFSPSGYAKLEAVAKAQEHAMRVAVKKGVRMAIGTDTGVSMPNSIATQGLNGKELFYHVRAGMTPLQAIEAATANGPLTLGPRAPKAGLLREGYDADFIALDENPLEDIKVLIGGKHVTHVWRQGKCYKWPGHPVSII
jgi:imidazolonepropionase-like amidohydrolase